MELYPVVWRCEVVGEHEQHFHTVQGNHFPFLARCTGKED